MAKSRRFLLSIIGGIFALSAALLFGEVLAITYLYIQEGQIILPSDRLIAQRNAYVEGVRTKDCTYGASVIVHPFLANVQSNRGPCGVPYANDHSFIGKEFPDRRVPRTGVILVTGGSVAAQFTFDNRQHDSHLERILNEQFTGKRFDRFIVLNGGHGAWKQPNQYILFGLYADVLDGVITLDGFNEHYMIRANQRFELPSNNFFETVRLVDSRSSMLTRFAVTLEAKLARFALDHRLFHVSSLAYLTMDSLRRGLRSFISSQAAKSGRTDDWMNASYDAMFKLNDNMGEEERQQWTLNQYEKYILLMHAGADAFSIKSLFLIQPTPAFGKPLTREEQLFAEKTNKPDYLKLRKHLVDFAKRARLPVHDLADVFADTKEPIYKDAIHVNDLGNQLMAERVADLIEHVWGWPRHRPVQNTMGMKGSTAK